MATKIEWCDVTINPVIGCSKCSPGCDNCYAEKFAARLARNSNLGLRAFDYQRAVENGRWSGQLAFDFKCFDKLPRRPASVFMASMGDVFHENVPLHVLADLWKKMAGYPQHQFLVLTKRAGNMKLKLLVLLERLAQTVFDAPCLPLPNVWLGVTVCNQAEVDDKMPCLMSVPGYHRFLSIEPLLGPIDLTGQGDLSLINAVIVGGETGTKARPMHPDWVIAIRNQCKDAGMPFFFKSWGEWGPCPEEEWHGLGPTGQPRQLAISPEGRTCGGFMGAETGKQCYAEGWRPVQKVGKKLSGRLLDGVEHNELPW